jgi:hypothetical protein
MIGLDLRGKLERFWRTAIGAVGLLLRCRLYGQVGNTSTGADWLKTISLFLCVWADGFFLYDFEQHQHQLGKSASSPKARRRISSLLDESRIRSRFICLRGHLFKYETMRGCAAKGGPRNQPRLHDLRHTSAVHRLVRWYREGKDVQTLLPQLSVYMGHTNLAATQVYLSMTPDLLHEASQRFERYAMQEALQ